jgi:hypothetical protein
VCIRACCTVHSSSDLARTCISSAAVSSTTCRSLTLVHNVHSASYCMRYCTTVICLQHCKAGDYTRFWSVFAKFGKVFSEEAQALLQTMLVFDPAQRVSFEDISKDPWLKGTTYSAEQLEVLLYTYTARVTRLQLLFTLFCFLSTADCCSASSDACDSVSRSWKTVYACIYTTL